MLLYPVLIQHLDDVIIELAIVSHIPHGEYYTLRTHNEPKLNDSEILRRLKSPSPELLKLVLENLPSEYEQAYEDDREFEATRHLLSLLADYLTNTR